MLTKRVLRLSVNSITALSKLCYLRSCLNSTKAIVSVNYHNSATEMSDFQNSTGYRVDNNFSDRYNSPSGSSAESENGGSEGVSAGSWNNSNRQSGIVSGYYNQNYVNDGQSKWNGYNQNANRVYGESFSQSNLVGWHGQTNGLPEPEPEQEQHPDWVTVESLDTLCEEGDVKKAVEVLGSLEKHHVPVELPRYLQLMKACGEAEALEEAKAVHEHVVRLVSPLEVSTYNKILEMYSKCGSMSEAFMVFDKMPVRNLTSWDTMITWLAKNGLGEEAIDLFTEFKKLGLKPDDKMFIGVLFACSVVSDVNEGILHFQSMSKDYGFVPSMEHYASVVDMLGSTGYLTEALEFIENMPLEPSVDVWETLMNLCRAQGHVELGDRCAEIVEQLDPSHLDEQSKSGLVPVKASGIANARKKKVSTQYPPEIRSRVREYRAGDTSHPESDRIYELLRGLRVQMNEAGYIPDTKFVLHDVDQESKETALLAHSERLAVAQALFSSPARSSIRVIKNLRVCGDCHNALKIISKIVGREIIARDAKRFHHFKDGLCSCGDYW